MKNKPNMVPMIMAALITLIAVIRAFSVGGDWDKIFGVIAVLACMIFIVAYRIGLRKQEKEKSE